MQVAENIVIDDADIPAGLDRLDLILEADAKHNLKRDDTKERLDNIDAMIAYILNELDDLDYDDPDPYAAEALGDEDIDDPLVDDPDYEDPDAVADVHVPGVDNVDELNEPFGPPDDPYADIEIPPPEGWDPGADAPALPNGLIDNREQWRAVDGYPNYEVSHHGNIRNAAGYILKPSRDKDDYLKVSLSRDGESKTHSVHRLVAKAWLPNPEDKPQVDHIDGNKRNNMLNNLRWATPVENMQNRGPNRLNTTGYKGVDIHQGRYRARIRIPGRRLHLGYFDTAEEAGAAYRAAALIHHGAYARGLH